MIRKRAPHRAALAVVNTPLSMFRVASRVQLNSDRDSVTVLLNGLGKAVDLACVNYPEDQRLIRKAYCYQAFRAGVQFIISEALEG